jgi:hypothetical protein
MTHDDITESVVKIAADAGRIAAALDHHARQERERNPVLAGSLHRLTVACQELERHTTQARAKLIETRLTMIAALITRAA